MKTKFLKELLEILKQIPDPLPGFMIRESMHFKYLRLGGHDPKTLYRGFKNLEHRGLVKKISPDFVITKKGAASFRSSIFYGLKLKKEKWDKKWRIVIFDIPELFKKQRKLFHGKLKSLGFYSLQKSVFVCPFSCEEELGFLSSYLGIGEYVDLIVAKSVGFKEEVIRKHYGL